MTSHLSSGQSRRATDEQEVALVETRIDPPHHSGPTEPVFLDDDAAWDALPETESASDEGLAELNAAQSLHAQQLAEHLAERQAELDRRDAQLQAYWAALENERREARLWFETRQDELDRRALDLECLEAEATARGQRLDADEVAHDLAADDFEKRCEAREKELAEQQAEIADAENRLQEQQAAARQAADVFRQEQRAAAEALRLEASDVDRRLSELDEESQRLVRGWDELAGQQAAAQRRAAELDSRAAALEVYAEDLERLRSAPGKEHHRLEAELADRAEALQAREAALQRQEAELASAQLELVASRQALEERAAEQAETMRATRERQACQDRTQQAELARKRQALERMSETLDQRRLTVEEMGEEVSRLHRETLEMRLATEELWSQLAGAAPPALLTQSLGRTRAALAQRFRQEMQQLANQRRELEQLKADAAEQLTRLEGQRRDVQQWLAEQQEELNRQADRLAAREERLARREQHISQAEAQWQEQRLAYQQQLRRLQTQASKRG